MSSFHILSIETSCDETSIAIIRSAKDDFRILANIVSSQIKLHSQWGGVVPNLAAREHVKNIPSVLRQALSEAKINISEIDLISVTSGPGLIPALLVGTNFAKTLSYRLEKPLIGIHHIEGHIYANFISTSSNDELRLPNGNRKSENIKFPILCLVVSGGHTQLVLMKNHLNYEIIGQTLDDAAGEAFDKVARILNIGYPGGPSVAQWASKFQETSNKKQIIINNQKSITKKNSYEIRDTKYEIRFPRPMMNKSGFNFSFSGLKTAVLYETKKNTELLKDEKYIAEVCHEFQQACIDVLIYKTLKAAEKFKPRTIMLAGGVSANKELRKQMGEAIKNLSYLSNGSFPSYRIPDLSLTGDNAAMIAAATYFRWQKMSKEQKKKAFSGWKTLATEANLKLR